MIYQNHVSMRVLRCFC